MKQFFHQIVSSLMALLVLASTVSWTVDKHICMGRVMDISLFRMQMIAEWIWIWKNPVAMMKLSLFKVRTT
ncbi:HYC_CC_PP family protein [Flagellimonas oceanensis]|uniref:HYC_CC_PP family protein n=1 Tax=Flagellimonas oceanensis TaxID=2499163 RepID=UPI001F264C60|nr:hypothetical protein [Allomuricauda oceanensis]